jgi:hypothetical protein
MTWNVTIKSHVELEFLYSAFQLYKTMRGLSGNRKSSRFNAFRGIRDVIFAEIVCSVSIRMGFRFDVHFCYTICNSAEMNALLLNSK